MKKALSLLLAGTLCGFGAIACDRETRVEAGREEAQAGGTGTGDYQPLPAPPTMPITGELLRIDTRKDTIVIRAENGMEQTFTYDDDTKVSGLEVDAKQSKADPKENPVEGLAGKAGGEVTIAWTADGDDKVATTITVYQAH